MTCSGGAEMYLLAPRRGNRHRGVRRPDRCQGGGKTSVSGTSLEEPRDGIQQPVPTGLVELDGGGGERPLQRSLGGWIFRGREVPDPARSIGKGIDAGGGGGGRKPQSNPWRGRPEQPAPGFRPDA